MIITKPTSYNNNDKQEHRESADLLQSEPVCIRSLDPDLDDFQNSMWISLSKIHPR